MRSIQILCLAMLCAMPLARADDPASGSASQPEDANDPRRQELHQLKNTMEKALNGRDMETLLANVDENVVFTTMNGDVAFGRDGIRQYFKKMMGGPGKVVESVTSEFIPDHLSVFYGDDIAVAFGHTNDHYALTTGQKFDINARWTATLHRHEGHWQVAAFHYSTNVFDNPILDTQRRWLIGAGAIAAVLLGLIGFFLGRRRSRPAA